MRRQHVRGHYVPASGEGHDRVLAPYAPRVLYKHGLYAIACSVDSDGALATADAPHVYAAERFTRAEHIRGTSFEVPKSFTLESFFQGAFGLFQGSRSIASRNRRFCAQIRALIEARIWHKPRSSRRCATAESGSRWTSRASPRCTRGCSAGAPTQR